MASMIYSRNNQQFESKVSSKNNISSGNFRMHLELFSNPIFYFPNSRNTKYVFSQPFLKIFLKMQNSFYTLTKEIGKPVFLVFLISIYSIKFQKELISSTISQNNNKNIIIILLLSLVFKITFENDTKCNFKFWK